MTDLFRPAERGRASTALLLAAVLLAGMGIWWITRPGTEASPEASGLPREGVGGGNARDLSAETAPLQASPPARSRPGSEAARGSGKTPTPVRLGDLDRATAVRIHEWETAFLDPNTTVEQKLAALENLVKNPFSREYAYQEIREVLTDHPDRKVVEGTLEIATKYPSESLDPFALEEAFHTRFHGDLSFRLKVIRALGANRRYAGARQVLKALHRQNGSGILQEALEKALSEH